MSRFTDYCSSAITPQMTLLEKFNALLKYLKETESTPKLYKHTIKFNNSIPTQFILISMDNEEITFENFNEKVRNSLVKKDNTLTGNETVICLFYYNGSVYYSKGGTFTGSQFPTSLYSSSFSPTMISDVVENL